MLRKVGIVEVTAMISPLSKVLLYVSMFEPFLYLLYFLVN